MRRLLILTLLAISLPGLAQTTNTPETVIAQESAFWKAWLTRTLPGFEAASARVYRCRTGDVDRDQVVSFVKQFHEHCTLAPVQLLDSHVTFLTPDIATLVYLATETPTCGNRTMSGDTNISSVWVREKGTA